MKKQADILDCTLRDGGYCNDWNFGEECIAAVVEALFLAGIKQIELGILSRSVEHKKGKTVYAAIEDGLKYIPDLAGREVFFLMNYGDYNLDDFSERSDAPFIAVRVAFHRADWKNALELCRGIKEKGYKIYPQPMATNLYTEWELFEMLRAFNDLQPDGMYIVDSFGSMTMQDVDKLYAIYNSTLSPDIRIGFHPHNNRMFALSNSMSFINHTDDRKKMVDASISGMGRGAGNLNLEVLMSALGYDDHSLLAIYEVAERMIKTIYRNHPWGYSIPYFISGLHCCHPNYASFLMADPAFSYQDIYRMIGRIPSDKREVYDEIFISDLCRSYKAGKIENKIG